MTSSQFHENFTELFVHSQRRIYGYILTVIPDRNEADEVFQETSLILWRKADEFDPNRDFVRWACGIATNVIRNRRVKCARDRHVFSEEFLEQIAEVRQSRSTWLDEQITRLAVCLQRLSDGQRRLLRVFYGDRYDTQQIAAELGIQENALYQRLHRIRRRLLDCVTQSPEPEAN